MTYIVPTIAMNNVQFVHVVRKIEKTLSETAVVQQKNVNE